MSLFGRQGNQKHFSNKSNTPKMKKKILVIEDNQEVRENITELLELSEFTTYAAENGKEGVRLAVENLPDLIICDVMMPELDGYGVLRILSNNPKTKLIPFIFLTAKAEKDDFRKGMNLGADDYLTKPFDDSELLSAVEMRLKKHEHVQQHIIATPTAFIDEEAGMKALEELAREQEIRSYHKKDIIYQEGEYPKQLFFVKQGKVKTVKANEDGKELILSLYGEKDFIGFLPFIQSTKYRESAVALEDTELFIIPQKEFLDLLQTNANVTGYLFKHLAQEVVEKGEQLIELAYNSVRKRVADALLRLQKHYQHDDDQFSMAIQRDDLASLVGTAKETVIRTLSDFKEEGLIDIRGSRITIIDETGLKEMLN